MDELRCGPFECGDLSAGHTGEALLRRRQQHRNRHAPVGQMSGRDQPSATVVTGTREDQPDRGQRLWIDPHSGPGGRPLHTHFLATGTSGRLERVPACVDTPEAELRARQATAFRTYVEPELEVLLRVARTLTGSAGDAEDLVQETLIRAWRSVDRFDGRHPRAWLFTILRNTNMNMNRRQRPVTVEDPAVLSRADPRSAPPRPRDLRMKRCGPICPMSWTGRSPRWTPVFGPCCC